MRAGNARDSLSYGEAARWLVYAQAYDYSGIKSGAVGDSRVKGGKGYPIGTGWTGMTGGVLVVGENLLDTLILNTCSSALTNSQDRPVWERQPDGPDTREKVGENAYPQGPSDLLTWQSRRIRLHPVSVLNQQVQEESGYLLSGDILTTENCVACFGGFDCC